MEGNIEIIVGRYYLVDSGYAVREGYLGPYRNTRYHLDDFRDRGAETVREKFNYHHSSLRNIVERAFGALKPRWQILELVPFYPRERQGKIILACFALHNYLKDLELEHDPNMNRAVDYNVSEWVELNMTSDMANVRDWIAAGIWFR